MNPLKIIICCQHLPKGYSGGRYHAWMIGVALASVGHDVTVWTNTKPQYAADFGIVPRRKPLKIHCDPHYQNRPKEISDWVIIVPDLSSPMILFHKWLLAAYRSRALVSMINFESPNYFNAFSSVKRDERLWDTWVETSRYSDGIFSLTALGSTYAERFYTQAPFHCVFRGCEPSINTVVADTVRVHGRRKSIIVITRFAEMDASHKGGDTLLEVIGEEMRGYEMAILVGKNGIPATVRERLEALTQKHGVTIRLLEGLSDEDKFREIKQAALMLFFSKFEGFGYPPVEALYCNTPCIASDLPVLREVSGEGLYYVDSEDIPATRKVIGSILKVKTEGAVPNLRKYVESIATIESLADRLCRLYTLQKDTGRHAIKSFPASKVYRQILIYDTGKMIRCMIGRLLRLTGIKS